MSDKERIKRDCYDVVNDGFELTLDEPEYTPEELVEKLNTFLQEKRITEKPVIWQEISVYLNVCDETIIDWCNQPTDSPYRKIMEKIKKFSEKQVTLGCLTNQFNANFGKALLQNNYDWEADKYKVDSHNVNENHGGVVIQMTDYSEMSAGDLTQEEIDAIHQQA